MQKQKKLIQKFKKKPKFKEALILNDVYTADDIEDIKLSHSLSKATQKAT